MVTISGSDVFTQILETQRCNSVSQFRRYWNLRLISKPHELEMWLIFGNQATFMLTFDPKALAQSFCVSYQLYHCLVLGHHILWDVLVSNVSNCNSH